MFVKPFKLHPFPHTIAVFISTYWGGGGGDRSKSKIRFAINLARYYISSFLTILGWLNEITETYICNQVYRTKSLTHIRQSGDDSGRPVRWLHQSSVTVLAFLISRPWLQLLAAHSSLQPFLPVSGAAAPPVRAPEREEPSWVRPRPPSPGYCEGGTAHLSYCAGEEFIRQQKGGLEWMPVSGR